MYRVVVLVVLMGRMARPILTNHIQVVCWLKLSQRLQAAQVVLLLLQHAPPEEFQKRLNIFAGWIPFLVEQLKDDKIKVRCQSCGRMDQRRSLLHFF